MFHEAKVYNDEGHKPPGSRIMGRAEARQTTVNAIQPKADEVNRGIGCFCLTPNRPIKAIVRAAKAIRPLSDMVMTPD